MGNFRIIGSAPEVLIEASGASLSDLFETSAAAVSRLRYDTSLVGFEREVSLVANGDDLEDLLMNWLVEVISLEKDHGFVPGDFLVVEVGEAPIGRLVNKAVAVRGAARGRRAGEWFSGTALPLLDVGDVRITQRRRAYRASIHLSIADPQ